MKGKDLPEEVRIAIALECARCSDPVTGNFISGSRRAIKSMFPDVSIETIKKLKRLGIQFASNPELLAKAIAGNRTGKCGNKSMLTDDLKGVVKQL